MPYSGKVPANRIDAFAWLGKTNWITPTAQGYRRSGELQAILNKSLQFGRGFANEVRDIINLSLVEQTPNDPRPASRTLYSDIYFMSSKVLATGQKTIQLSQEWCEAFENTELTLQFKDYRQPFPTMVIEFPANYAENKFVPGAGDYPEFVAVHHEEQERVLIFEMVFRQGQLTTLIPYRLDDEIESILHKLVVVPLDDVGFEKVGTEAFLVPFLRIALNAIVAMIYGTEWQKLERTRNERQTRKKLTTQTHAKDKAAAMKARLRLGTLPEYFQFDQTIKAFDEQQRSHDEEPDGDGTHKKTHWRRGHWRQQAVGPGRTLRELRWIRPMLINAGQFKGDLKDTTTTYTTS
jgi:hypothetical protein